MNIPLPIRGLNRGQAYSNQPENTAVEALNVCGVDGVTSRTRLSQVSGQSRWCPDDFAMAKIDRLASVVFDSRRVSYEPLIDSLVETVWARSLEGARVARAGVVDRQGALYIMDGARTVVKVNADGARVWELTLPVPSDAQVVEAIDVDDNGNLFLGTSSGGRQEDGRIWRYQPKRGSVTPVLVWTYDVDGFVVKLRARGDTLYAAVNQNERNGALIVQLTGSLSAGPTLGWRREAAYPVADMRLKGNGDVIYTSDANATRGIDPQHPNFTERTEDWRIEQLENYDKIIWCDLDASRIANVEDGEAVGTWLDTSGNGRHLGTGFTTGSTSPLYKASAINGLPAVRFRGKNTTYGYEDEMNSGTNASTDSASVDQQLTTVPAARGSTWAMFMIVRPTLDSDSAPAAQKNQCLFSIPIRDDGVTSNGPGVYDLEVWVNRSNDLGDANHQTGERRGAISVLCKPRLNYEGAAANADSGRNFPIHWYYSVEDDPKCDTGTLLLTLVWDSGQNETVDDGTVPHCTLRINGKPIDRWVAPGGVSDGPVFLGTSFSATGMTADNQFQGDIARLLVFRGRTGMTGGLMSMPLYPRTVGNVTGASVPVAWDPLSDTELERVEGNLMHKYGISHQMPDTATAVAPTLALGGYPAYDPGHYPHPYQRFYGPPRADGAEVSTPYRLNSPKGLVAKLDGSRGELQWVATSSNDNLPFAIGIGGVGQALAVFEDRIFCAGPAVTGGLFPARTWGPPGFAGDIKHLRCIIDNNRSGMTGYSTLIADGAWSVALAGIFPADPDGLWPNSRPGLDVDEFGNLYVPAKPGAALENLTVYSPTGILLYAITNVTDSPLPIAVLAQRDSPNYRVEDFPDAPTVASEFKRAEFAYLLGSAGDNEVWKVRLVEATASTGSARTVQGLAFTGGNLWRVARSGAIEATSGGLSIKNPVYSTNSGYVSGATAYGKHWFSDGERYYVYDPITDSVTLWTSTDAGQIPPRCRLVELWNGRIVLARAQDDPHGWHMSERGNPQGWDFFPVPRSSTMAVSAVTATAGSAPDAITSLIPYSDDYLIVGCDSSVWILRGDPAANGVFDRVSDITGIAFGRCWTKDPAGILYFFGSRGGVYRMVPGGIPESMTDSVIDREMRDIDLSTHYVEMLWNDDEDILHVFVYSFAAPSEPTRGWIWQRRVDGWFRRETSLVGVTPTAAYAMDGDDPLDRVIVVGGADGRLRWIDPEATNDGSTIVASEEVTAPIQSVVKWGPIAPGNGATRYRFRHPRFVLDSEQQGCYLKIYAGEDPVQGGQPAWEGELYGGRTRALPMRATGQHVWLELHSFQGSRRWSVESGDIEAVAVGRSHE